MTRGSMQRMTVIDLDNKKEKDWRRSRSGGVRFKTTIDKEH